MEPCVIKVLGADATGFAAVDYNEKKVAEGAAELVRMINFGLLEQYGFHAADTVKKFLQKIADKNDRVQHPQLHLMISYPGIPSQEQKEILLKNLEETLDSMGYKDQPVLIYAHHDTDHFHFHAVSSRVMVGTGEWINNSFEGVKARKILDDLRGIKHDKLLDGFLGYNYTSREQFQHILRANGYHSMMNEENGSIEVYRGFQNVFSVSLTDIETKAEENKAKNKTDRDKQLQRIRQVRAIISKYREKSLNGIVDVPEHRTTKRGRTHAVTPKKAEVKRAKFQGCDGLELSELKKAQFKQFLIDLKRTAGLEILFHKCADGKVRGYSVIDNSKGYLLNGSAVMKLTALLNGKNMKEDIIPEELAAEASQEYRAERNAERDKIDASNIYGQVQEKLKDWKFRFNEPSFLKSHMLHLSAEESCQKAVELLIEAEQQRENNNSNWPDSAQLAAEYAYAAHCKHKASPLQTKQGAKIIPFVSIQAWGTVDKEGRPHIGIIIDGKKYPPKPLALAHHEWYQQQPNKEQAMQDLLVHYFADEIQKAQVNGWKELHFNAGKMPFGITVGEVWGHANAHGNRFWVDGDFTRDGQKIKTSSHEVSRSEYVKFVNSEGDAARSVVCNSVGRELVKDWSFNPVTDIKNALFDSPSPESSVEGVRESVQSLQAFTEQLCNDFMKSCGQAAVAYFNAMLPTEGVSTGGGGGGAQQSDWGKKKDEDDWLRKATGIMGFVLPRRKPGGSPKR